jgi:hypothetical protein
MNLLEFLSKTYPGKDLHVVEPLKGHEYHVGYYFWNDAKKEHYLQPICAMRSLIGLEVADIKELCQAALRVKIARSGDECTSYLSLKD